MTAMNDIVANEQGGVFVENSKTERIEQTVAGIENLLLDATLSVGAMKTVVISKNKDDVSSIERRMSRTSMSAEVFTQAGIDQWIRSKNPAVLLLSSVQYVTVQERVRNLCTLVFVVCGEMLNGTGTAATALSSIATKRRIVFLTETVKTNAIDFYKAIRYAINIAMAKCRFKLLNPRSCEALTKLRIFFNHNTCDPCTESPSEELDYIEEALNPRHDVRLSSPDAPSVLRMTSHNAQSIKKPGVFEKIIRDEKKRRNGNAPDALFVCETKLKEGIALEDMKVDDLTYKFHRRDLPTGKAAGGVGLFVRSDLEAKRVDINELDVTKDGNTCRLISVYKRPGARTIRYVRKFIHVLTDLVKDQNNFVIAGDFNMHFDTNWLDDGWISTGRGMKINNMLRDFVKNHNFY
ncbi:hypothetical protein QR680_012239 [Steinernema hermaphroditum]|uniref:Endonuclease/exonuclease/phosphatase domain-containing protein n=1 Tax=Steinernema hermaphroditum TaxID=289476 RepID=A0AA39M070_9BILA|nr:hypothetical protein QR680_012239 [Steinernema hermaphroditum]